MFMNYYMQTWKGHFHLENEWSESWLCLLKVWQDLTSQGDNESLQRIQILSEE